MTGKREPPLHLASVLRPLKEILFFDVEREQKSSIGSESGTLVDVHIFSAKPNLEYTL